MFSSVSVMSYFKVFDGLHFQEAVLAHELVYRRWKVLHAMRENFIVYPLLFTILLLTHTQKQTVQVGFKTPYDIDYSVINEWKRSTN